MAHNQEKKRLGNVSAEQKELLLNFMEKHPRLRQGKYGNDFTRKNAEGLWQEVTEQLNQLVEGKKDWKAWRKTWHDLFSKCKQKQSRINNHRRATGGGKDTEEKLSQFEEHVVELMAVAAVEGHTGVAESEVEDFLNDPFEEELLLVVEDDDNLAPHNDIENDNRDLNEMDDEVLSELHTDTAMIRASLRQIAAPHHIKRSQTGALGQKPRTREKKRLTAPLPAQKQVVKQLQEQNQILQDYYERKLALYERLVVAKEKYYQNIAPE